jgi:zinc protease
MIVSRGMMQWAASAIALVVILLAGGQARGDGPLRGVYGTRLANGWRVLFYEDHSVPKVVVVNWVHVGSRDEEAGRTGFAHLFEHLMFKGTAGIADGRLDAILEEGGGFSSAFTTSDQTVFWEDAASNYLETILWLEGDRVATLVDRFPSKKLENQQDVVRNERRQGLDNTPYARAYEVVQNRLWPAGHGYHWLVIGSHEDLAAATVDDVVAFYRKHYVPANMTMVIAGDFERADARRLVLKYLARVPGRPAPERRRFVSPAPLAGPVLEVMRDDVAVPRVHVAWRGPAAFAADEAAAILATRMLGGGKASRLYERLVYRDRLAQDVDATFEDADLGATIRIIATAKPGVQPERLRAAIGQEVARLAGEPPPREELDRARNAFEGERLAGLEILRSRAIRIAAYDVQLGNPDGLEEDLARFRRVSPEQVAGAAARWLDPKARVEVTILPARSAP